MAKKIQNAEAKKECPSCGLGVPMDATICEFCGWDFQDENEWVLQIEKLERDLMLEKQKFKTGTVDQQIESSLHTPAYDRIEMIKTAQKDSPKPEPRTEERDEPAKQVATIQQRPSAAPPRPEPQEAPQPSGKVRRVRTVKSSPQAAIAPLQEPPRQANEPAKKSRLVRKVKQ